MPCHPEHQDGGTHDERAGESAALFGVLSEFRERVVFDDDPVRGYVDSWKLSDHTLGFTSFSGVRLTLRIGLLPSEFLKFRVALSGSIHRQSPTVYKQGSHDQSVEDAKHRDNRDRNESAPSQFMGRVGVSEDGHYG